MVNRHELASPILHTEPRNPQGWKRPLGPPGSQQQQQGDTHIMFLEASATDTVLSWLTQARRLPLAEKLTLCTHPPLPAPPNSDISCPKGILEPQGVLAGFSSTSLM